jgi:hypothetical protein
MPGAELPIFLKICAGAVNGARYHCAMADGSDKKSKAPQDTDSALAKFIIGGIPLVLRRGPETREFHIESAKASSAFGLLARLLIDKLSKRLDCECGILGQHSAYAKIANTFVQPCRGVSVQGFAHDGDTARESVGNREIQGVLAEVAAEMPGWQEFSDYIERLEEEDEKRCRRAAAKHQWVIASNTAKPNIAPREREEFAIGQTRVTLEHFGGETRFHLGFEGPRDKTWKVARNITDALKEHKLKCECLIPLLDVDQDQRLNDDCCVILKPGEAEREEDYGHWYHMKSPPRMVIYASVAYDMAMLASGFNIPRVAHIKCVLRELAERQPAIGCPPEWCGGAPRDYSVPSGSPQKTEEFQVGDKHVTLSQFPDDPRLHLKIEGFSGGDMLEPVFLIGDAIQEHNLACDCTAVATDGKDVYLIPCFINPNYIPSFDAWDNLDDYSQKKFDPLDHLGNPARMVIQPLAADAGELRHAGMEAQSFDKMCAVLDGLSDRFPPFGGDLLHAYNELSDKAKAREARRRKKNDQKT